MMVCILVYTVRMLSSHSILLGMCLAEKFSLYCVFHAHPPPPPLSLVVPWGDRKVGLSSYMGEGGVLIPLMGDVVIPWDISEWMLQFLVKQAYCPIQLSSLLSLILTDPLCPFSFINIWLPMLTRPQGLQALGGMQSAFSLPLFCFFSVFQTSQAPKQSNCQSFWGWD